MTAWPAVKLGDVARPVARAIAPQPGTTYRQIGVRLWGQGAYEREPVDGSATKYSTLFVARANDIVVNKIWARNGSVAVVPSALAGTVGSGEFPMFEVDQEKLLPLWMHWLTKTPTFWTQCDAKSQGTSGKNRIRPDQFLSIAIPLPSLPEQQRLAARIEALTVALDGGSRLNNELLGEAEALVAVTGNSIFSNRNHWPTVLLEEVATIRSGVTLGRVLTGETISLPYLRVANVQDGHLDLGIVKRVAVLPREADKWRLRAGDLLMTEGGDWDKLGRCAEWNDEIADCIHQNHIFCVRAASDAVLPKYLAKLIGSPVGKAYFQVNAKQTTNLASINQRQLRAFLVPLPSVDHQQRIVNKLDALQAEANALKAIHAARRAELDALLPAILDRAFAGAL